MKTYTVQKFEDGSQVLTGVTDSGQSWGIPFDEANSDYQAYLKWVEAGGVAEVIEA